MEKVIRDGQVAVLYSPEYGSGWYTTNDENEILLFHPKLVEVVESGDRGIIDENWVLENLGVEDVYCGGAQYLKIAWIEKGTAFIVDEYDGYESIRLLSDVDFILA